MPTRKSASRVPNANNKQRENNAKARKKPLLLHPYENCPAWMQDNDFITHGYRVDWGWRGAMKSLCSWHNETMNVWTHLVGSVFVLLLLFATWFTLSPWGAHRLNALSAVLQGDDNSGSRFCVMEEQRLWQTPQLHTLQHNHSTVHDAVHVSSPVQWPVCVALPPASVFAFFSQAAAKAKHVRSEVPMWPTVSGSDSNAPLHLHEDTHESGIVLAFHHVVDVIGGYLPNLDQITASLRGHAANLEDNLEKLVQSGTSSAVHAWDECISKLEGSIAGFQSALDSAKSTCSVSLSKLESSRLTLKQHVAELSDLLHHHKDTLLDSSKLAAMELADLVHKLSTGVDILQSISPSQDEKGILYFLPRWPLAAFMVSAVFCMGMSATFHLLQAVSAEWAWRFQRLDYAGITLLISGSQIPILYYGFFCEPQWVSMYMIFVVGLGVIGFIISMIPFIYKPQNRYMRVVLFVSMAAAGVVPLVHMFRLHGEVLEVMFWLVAMGVIYISGAMLYVTRVPERCKPGSFDHVGASHQLFHICVFLAVLVHYWGMRRFYEWRIHTPCPVAQ